VPGMSATERPTLTDVQPEWRLADCDQAGDDWSRWGPYLSERHWGTVREDYSADGDAWSYLPHDQSLSRAYRWGEDGLAGFGDRDQRLCLAVALWNGRDPVLKERLFGLTGPRATTARTSRSTGDTSTRCLATPGIGGATTTRRIRSRTPTWSPRTPAAGTTASRSCSTRGVFDEDRCRIVDVTRAGRIAPDRLDRARRQRDPPARGGALPRRHPAHPGPWQAAMTTTVTTPPAGSPVLPAVPFPLGATPGRHRVPVRRPHLHPCTVPARTVWIIDTTDSPGTVDDQFYRWSTARRGDFVHPLGWTTPPRGRRVTDPGATPAPRRRHRRRPATVGAPTSVSSPRK
jgi:hypothetical protein